MKFPSGMIDMPKTVIWVDDLRDPFSTKWSNYISERVEEDFKVYWAKNSFEFEKLIHAHYVLSEDNSVYFFFDNDLGEESYEGYTLFCYLERIIHEYGYPKCQFFAQTSNPSALLKLKSGFKSLQKYWDN